MRKHLRIYCYNILIIGLCGSINAFAHPTLSDSIGHSSTLTIGAQYIDATVELTFLGTHAQIKRRELDLNKDGHIESSELKAYSRSLLPKAAKYIRLKQGQAPLDLISLYDPEIDVGSTRDISTTPVTIRISFFTSTPKNITTQNQLSLHDTFYSGIPGIYRHSVLGTDGLHTTLISQPMISHKPSTKKQTPVLKVTVTPATPKELTS